MNRSAAGAENVQQRAATAVDPAPAADLPVTWYRDDEGNDQVLSRYGDPVWEYPTMRFPSSVPNNQRNIRFDSVPAPFRTVLRDVIREYDRLDAPAGNTLIGFFAATRLFLRYLAARGLTDLADVRPLHCLNYVAYCRRLPGRNGRRLSGTTLENRFHAIEKLHMLVAGTPRAFPPPWPECSARHLAGLTRADAGSGRAKTRIIPDEQLRLLFARAVRLIDEADPLLALADELETLRAHLQARGTCGSHRWHRKRLCLQRAGYVGTPSDFEKALDALQNACMVVILTLSGIRVHELCYLRNASWRTVTDAEGDCRYWMRSRSDKTGAGNTEWLIPEMVTRALDTAEALARPLQTRWAAQRAALLEHTPDSRSAYRMAQHDGALFLGVDGLHNGRVSGLSAEAVNKKINRFAADCGVTMHLTPHQFRRTFANFVAKSAYGDLRYLREHFKHWSLDMTALYALNEAQDAELYDEIMTAVINQRLTLVRHWLDEDTPLAGGNGERIRAFRGKDTAVRTYPDRRRMLLSIADTIFIRGTPTAWCTADDGGCAGQAIIECTRCAQCDASVIDDRHGRRWAAIYAQTLELRNAGEIGPAGHARVERDIQRCEHVLREFGILGACRASRAIQQSVP